MPDSLRDQLQESFCAAYTIERELGRGGMATVFLARDAKHHRHVALKVLDRQVAASLGTERFLAEIRDRGWDAKQVPASVPVSPRSESRSDSDCWCAPWRP